MGRQRLREGAMLYRLPYEHPLDRLGHQLQQARSITPDLIAQVIAQACVRFTALGASAKAKVDRLIASSAWTDAAFALLALELPQWSIRRLIRDDSEWLCSLSHTPALPPDLDETIEATHQILPLAVLLALLEARRVASAEVARSTTVPQVRPLTDHLMCTDNFS